jgi:hypothetical protein
MNDQFPISDFMVDVRDRTVIHKPSKILFSFYEYRTEDDWETSQSVIYRDNPDFTGDRLELAAAAKRAALANGMKARKPALQHT